MEVVKSSERGYALLLTLLLLTLVGLALGRLCRRSLEAALVAKRAEEDLQRRWGLITVQKTLLSLLPTALEEEVKGLVDNRTLEESPKALVGPPPQSPRPTREGHFELGKLSFEVVFADEEAKLNLNTLLREFKLRNTTRIVEDVVQRMASPLKLNLRPYERSTQKLLHSEALGSFSQVFEDFDAGLLLGGAEGYSPLEKVTLWGSGKLRFALAPKDALETLLEPVMKPEKLKKLLQLQTEEPTLSVDQLTQSLALNPEEAIPLKRLLSESPSAYSLRVTIRD